MSEETASHQEIFFRSYNESSSTTIVLLHGLFSCSLEWEHVVPHLKDHHLIIPDLPQHSKSRDIGPFSVGFAADSVANLINNHAHGSKAHVAGLSLGGFVTMELIRRHSAVVKSAFVTGATPFSPWQVWAAQRPNLLHYGLLFVMYSGIYRLAEWKTGLKPHDELKEQILANNQWELVKAAYGELAEWQQEAVKDVGQQDKRVLAVCGDQGDNVEGTKEMAQEFRRQGHEDGTNSGACVIKGAIHGWNLQFPEHFADGIKAWVEEQPLPEEFQNLL
ncbi:hypothetical protein NM208_g14227 [Fusarium decemcellulare]|uniref:Uncharacterized protein n=1 Tax=Fusarium decemcellulare TaxID=57161 RepID=A0ACC1RGT1_9HYPO|nr:hypothetical protein NM208_g14227 [Fusarium decemcellulare]